MNEALEAAIDEVGRDRVFGRASSYGWPRGSAAPEWVWWGIVQELRENKPPPARQAASLMDVLGLGGIFSH